MTKQNAGRNHTLNGVATYQNADRNHTPGGVATSIHSFLLNSTWLIAIPKLIFYIYSFNK